MRKIMIYISLALLAVIVITIAVWGLRILFNLGNPMRQPKEQIRESILEQTPIGMSMEEVVKVVESNKWDIERVSDKTGVLYAELGYPRKPEDIALNRQTVIGKKSIRAIIGKYRNFFETWIDVHWAFDENSELIEVFVIKGTIGF